jgi:hypothetical protein
LLGSGTSLSALTSTVATRAAALVGGTPSSATPSLPAEWLLKPAASNCSALRSGKYHWMMPIKGGTLADQFDSVSINASTLVATRGNGSTATWVPKGTCRYTSDAGRTEVVVSQAGVIVSRYLNGSTYRTAFAVPEQAHSLAELAGDWNLMGMQTNASATGYTGITGSATLDISGIQVATTLCQNDITWGVKGADCTSPATLAPGFQPNGAAGFDLVDSAKAVKGRAFLYRGGNGDVMLVRVDSDGSFQLRTKQRTNPLPAVGAVSANWDTYVDNQLVPPSPLDAFGHTILSVDSVAQSYTRTQKNLVSLIERTETLFTNNPRNGYNYRPAGTTTASNGTTVSVNEITTLPMRGMGLGAVLLTRPQLFDFSLAQP